MKRFSESNLAILHGGKHGYFYDVPTSSIFKVSKDDAQKADGIQHGNTRSEEYAKFEKTLSDCVGKKQITSPSHTDFFTTHSLSKLTLLVSTTCNLRCKYCYAGFGAYHGYEAEVLTPQNAVNYITALNKYFNNIDQIQFFGGEPLMGIEAIDSVCMAIAQLVQTGQMKKIPRYTMITNLTLLSEKAHAVIQRNNIRLTVSIDGSREINDKLRITSDGMGTFDTIANNIAKCKDQIYAFEATFTKIHEEHGWTMETLKQYLKNAFVMSPEMIYVCPAANNDISNYAPAQTVSSQLQIDGMDIDNVSCLYALKPEHQSDLLCSAGFAMLALMPNGDLYPCHFYALDRSFCMGSYLDFDFPYIHENVDRVRRKLLDVCKPSHVECRECWARNICHRCPPKSLILNHVKRLNFECYNRKIELKQNLVQALEVTLSVGDSGKNGE